MNKSDLLLSICEDLSPSRYIGVLLASEFRDSIYNHIQSLLGDKVLDKDELHCTIMYSNGSMSDTSPIRDEYGAQVVGYDLFGENKDTLVALLSSDDLITDHAIARGSREGDPTYPKYRPHMTLINNNATEEDLELVRSNPLPVSNLLFRGHME